jgi:type VI protein secretion system component Hcp
MKKLLLLLLALPLLTLAQKDEGFALLIRDDGAVIKGSSVTQLYERQIPVYNLETNSAANSTTIRFTMGQEAAAAILRDMLQQRRSLLSGSITITFISLDRRLVRYKINMENVAIERCEDANGMTTVQLHATRIGWTYYSYSKSGTQTISSKSGWDEQRQQAWTAF